jgi:hypothetical protein
MSFAPGHAKAGGRRKGARNKRTLAAEPKTYADALRHLAAVMAAKDPTITPELRLRAAIALAQYQRPKPTSLKPVPGQPIDLEPPKSAEEAREAIAKITSMIARTEIDGEHGGRVIAGLEAFLAARAAELEAEVEKHRAEEGL